MTGILNLLAGSISSAIKDGYFNLVTLLLPGDGTNGAQNNTFLDSSSNNFTITRNGNTTQGTFSPFSQTGWSNFFNGSSYLQAGSNAALAPGSGNFTVEFWVFPTAGNTFYNALYQNYTDGLNRSTAFRISINNADATSLLVQTQASALITTSTGVLNTNAWNHVALVRNGSGSNNLVLYVNGVSVGTATNTTNFSDGFAQIGNTVYNAANYYWNGYISNFRVVPGTAVYTAAFTPPTSPLTAISGTALLTCQSNRFIDNSTNAFSITVNGTPSVQAFSPFAPTAAYSAATVDGSGYFDGSGDSISAASNAAFALSTGDFSMECWIYFVGTAAGGGLSGEFFGSTTTNAAVLRYKTGTLAISRANTADDMSASVTMTVGQWYHVCATRTGTTGGLYLNGTRVATNASYTASYAQGDMQVISGTNGYLSGCRLIKGSNPYGTGTTLTLPTAPVTNITNTSLLLNFTNAGIYDAAAKNDLETVGNAQVSTTQSKFGGSSLYFDGSGDGLRTNDKPVIRLGTGPFTVEFWFNTTATTQYSTFISNESSSGGQGFSIIINSVASNGIIQVYSGTAGLVNASTASYRDGAWHHLALCRDSSGSRLYIDGSQIGTTNSGQASTNFDNATPQPWAIGYNIANAGRDLLGYIDELRITVGVARYTGSTYTVPTAAFPLQ